MEVITSKLRIDKALKEKGKTRADLARELQVERSSVSEMLNSPGEAPLKYLEAASRLTGVTVDHLRTGLPDVYQYDYGKSMYELQEPDATYLKGRNIRPITVVVDRSGKELISYVPVKAQAGYRKGFGDPKFIEKLPAYSLPINVAGTHRMFQVDGNSMRQLGGGGLNDGDIVIAHYVEDIFSIKDSRVYVVVSTEGIIVKRCINRLTTDKVLVANSDNKNGEFPAIILHPNEILEVWEYKAHISKQLSFATDLWDVINNLQVQQALMKDELDGIRKNILNG